MAVVTAAGPPWCSHGPCGGVGRQRLGLLDSHGGLGVSGIELAIARTDRAHPQVAVVAGAVLGHRAVIDHG